jgi:hypothetical protein
VRVVGTRHTDSLPMADQAALARTTALLRGTAHLVPRGVYRFSSFDEADAWMTQMLLRTHAHAVMHPIRHVFQLEELMRRR